MNSLQKDASHSTWELNEKRYNNRTCFAALTVGGILLILLVAYHGKSLGLGGIGAVGVWVSARVVMNYSGSKKSS
ncbi:MAG TPA: hypothetical protein VK249_20880 [Anaerolineales bacterium]|nr:hypothetical protein [Anaerolineales bacterium]